MDVYMSHSSPNGSRKRRRPEVGKTTDSQVSSRNPSIGSHTCQPSPPGQLESFSPHAHKNGEKQERGNNRSEDDEEDPYGDNDWGDADLPNDTIATILTLQREFYGGRAMKSSDSGSILNGQVKTRTGVVLQHQIYTILENRTAVDLELTDMRNNNTLRMFSLNSGRDDWAVMSTEHYLKMISNALGGSGSAADDHATQVKSGASSFGQSTSDMKEPQTRQATEVAFARDVLVNLVRSITKAFVSRKDVAKAMEDVSKSRPRVVENEVVAKTLKLSEACASRVKDKQRKPKGRVKVLTTEELQGGLPDLKTIKQKEERVVSLIGQLIRAGFLIPRRDVVQENAYWFTMPQLGKIITAMNVGRKAIVNMIKRTRYKEIRRAALESKNPAKTGLPLGFHLRDLVGLGMLLEVQTPSGVFLRVAKDA